jgi:hypothetical protein
MNLTPEQLKKLLAVLFGVFVLLIGYRVATYERPRTAPLTYTRGAVASSPVRPGLRPSSDSADPLAVLLQRGETRFPGVARDLFRMENPAPRTQKPVIMPVATAPTPTGPPPKTPEELAADAARLDLSKFRFLGYLTEKDSSLFLSKDGEVYVVRSGDPVLKSYRVKSAGKDHVMLRDSATGVEVRIELSGGGEPAAQAQQKPR